MPSRHQRAARAREYESDAMKMLATKNDLTVDAVIRGIRDPNRARSFIAAEIELADREDRDPRKELIGALNRRAAAVHND